MKTQRKYISKRKFKIWIYSASHSTLIIRSEKQYPDVDYDFKYDDPGITIDVEFSGVKFISIPSNFNDLLIEKIGDNFIFNNIREWYVQADSCVIGQSSWDIENVIDNMKLKYDDSFELQ